MVLIVPMIFGSWFNYAIVMLSVTGFFLNVKSRCAVSDTEYWYVWGPIYYLSVGYVAADPSGLVVLSCS